MADTTARALRLLGLLQRRPSWSGTELADRLGVGKRTVRRDIDRLRGLGYPVEGTPGTVGGYRLRVGTDLPPLLLDDDEAMAVAVVLGVSAGAAIPGIDHAALATLARIDRLLPPRLRSQLGALRASTVALIAQPPAVPTENLVRLAQACDGHELAAFTYRDRDGRESERRAEPYRLVTTERSWYLVAYDLDRQDWRTFRVDRLSDLRVTGHTFVPRPLADPGRLVSEGISVAPYRHKATVRINARPDEVTRKIPPDVGVVEPDGDGSLLKIGADEFAWLAGRLAGLDLEFEVIEPPELRTYLSALGRRLVRAHRPGRAGNES